MLMRPNNTETAVHYCHIARVIWLCACLRWLDCGAGVTRVHLACSLVCMQTCAKCLVMRLGPRDAVIPAVDIFVIIVHDCV